jgi:hypothetical protein
VLDLGDMKGLEFDVEKRTAWAETGLTAGEFTAAAGERGLAVGFGDTGAVGIGGITLGGGVGFLVRKYGLTIDDLLAAEVVTADGQVLHVDDKSHPDLFWAIRGGGGNFGIATEFVLQLSPLGPTVLGGLAFWAPEHGPELLRRYREFCKSCPDEVTTVLLYLHAPPFDFVPKDVQLKPGYALVVVGTDVTVAERAVKDLRSFAPPLFDIIGPMPYLAVQGMFDPAQPPGTKTYFKAHYIHDLSDEVIRTLHAQTAKMPPGRSTVFVIQMGGAVSRVAEAATAFGGRSAAFQTLFLGVFDEPAERDGAVKWTRGIFSALEPFAHGAYVNLSDTQDESTLKITYGPEKYAKLQRIKAKYDPDNVFSLNQNIKPAK